MDPCLQLLVPSNVFLIIIHKSLKRSTGVLRGAIATTIPVTVGRGIVEDVLLGGGPRLHLPLGGDGPESSLHGLCLDVLVLQVARVLVLVG